MQKNGGKRLEMLGAEEIIYRVDNQRKIVKLNGHVLGSAMSGNKIADDVASETLLHRLKGSLPKLLENTDLIRNAVIKLHDHITSSDQITKEKCLEAIRIKDIGAIEIFIALLEASKDNIVYCNIVGILHECVSPRLIKVKGKSNKRNAKNSMKSYSRAIITQLIQNGGTQVLIKLLINCQHGNNLMNQVIVQEGLWILGQIAQKEQKFVTKVKLLNATKMFYSLLKLHCDDHRSLLPLLLIFKSFSKNTSIVQILVKEGITTILEKTFLFVTYTPHIKLKILLESFKHFTLNRLFCINFVKNGMVHLLMRIFERWDRYDGPIRLKIANCTLTTLSHLCSLKSGRKAIKSNNGLQLLYRFCTNCPEDKAYDVLLSRVCGIINQCLEKKELPVPELSPARFILPTGNEKRMDPVESCSDEANSINSPVCGSDLYSGDDDEENSASTSEDCKNLQQIPEVDEGQFFAGVITSQRSPEDLLNYHPFFKELDDVDAQVKSDFGSTNFAEKKQKLPSEGVRKLKSTQGIGNVDPETAYCIIASKIRSVIPFIKVAYPDLIGSGTKGVLERLNDKDRQVCRLKLLNNVDKALRHCVTNSETVFDLDKLINSDKIPQAMSNNEKFLGNFDIPRLGRPNLTTKSLQFESRFESGNLRRAIQITLREYDLILSPDVNSLSRHQWFYFEVSNMEANMPYTFNIINCEKPNSQFNFGMKPILFSVAEAQWGRPGWIRIGSDVCYYRNSYKRPGRGKNYLTTSFTVTFPHRYDVCYLAYHFPFSYSQLMRNIWQWSKTCSKDVLFNADVLCDTLNGNECPVMTITATENKANPINSRKIIFLTSRVHPGESNASWVMQGTLEALLNDSTHMKSLRDDYIFKIVPMLNIDGVINGCNRYGLTNEDLNRRWSNPDRLLHPVIYNTKGLMEYCTRVLLKPPHVFVDYHGHSRRKNIFLFGCSRSASWSAADRAIAEMDQPVQYLMLPHLMQKTSPAFALPLCSFKVERNKESTARVAIWRQLGVARSYTMESSFCGCDQGPLAGFHFDTQHLKNVGKDFCEALAGLKDSDEKNQLDNLAIQESNKQNEEDSDDDLSLSSDSDDSASDID